jgi:hypothetical protein
MSIYNIHLFLQLFIICYWIYTNYNIIRKRKYVQNPIFYGLIFSSFGIISVLIMEVTFNKGDLTFNNWGWYPTNVLLNYTFNLIVNYFKKHKKELKSIEEAIDKGNLNLK